MFAFQLHVLHMDLFPGSHLPRRHAGFHHSDHVPQLLQEAHLTPRGWRRADRESNHKEIAATEIQTVRCFNGSLVSQLAQVCGVFSFLLQALPALSELFVLGDRDLEQTGTLHQGGHHCLPLLDLPLEHIQHLVGFLAVKSGRMRE